ncbi:MAG TPA: SDR family oxidoreductase [Acidimicrobiales bacterium]|nr:SDR family oxidoreductase [Acidimicrobiales bacterium]
MSIGRGTTVVVTGASSGIGRATVRLLGQRGAGVALLARNVEALEAAAKEVEAAGGRALVVPVDVADAEAVADAARRVEEELGPIDVWVNNAMTAVLAPVSETSAAEFRRVTEVTYLGYVHGTLAVLPRMRSRDRGVIVQVGSALAYRSIPLQASYCAAKHAVKGFTEALRCELLHDRSNVKVTMVQLPGVNTPQFEQVKTTLPKHPMPVPPVYQPEVAARAIVWAAEHPRRREVYVGGPTPLVVWAGRLVPGLVDRYLAATNYKAQQAGDPVDPDRPTYLWQPVPGDRGAHGRFDDIAHPRSLQFAAAARRRSVAFGAAAGALVVGAAVRRSRS